MAFNDPTHISGTVLAKDKGLTGRGCGIEDGLDRSHGGNEAGLLAGREGKEHLLDLLAGASIEGGELFLAGFGEEEMGLSCISGRGLATDEFAVGEGAEDSAEITEVECDGGGNL